MGDEQRGELRGAETAPRPPALGAGGAAVHARDPGLEAESPYKAAGGLRRVVLATRYSLAGLAAAWRHEAAFRTLALLSAVLVPLGLWLGRTPVERALLSGSVLLAPVVELVNAAIEATIDRVSYERHPLAKRAKDLGSAAVMLALATAGLVWLLVLIA